MRRGAAGSPAVTRQPPRYNEPMFRTCLRGRPFSQPTTVRTWVVAGLVTAVMAAATAGAQSPQAQADRAQAKLNAVMADTPKPAAAGSRRTVFTQNEMNAYLQHRAKWIPPGITDPSVQFLGANRIATLVTADLDGVRRKSSGGWFDPDLGP